MKTPRKPRPVWIKTNKDHVQVEVLDDGKVSMVVEAVTGKVIIKLIYWLMRYRFWQCRETK